MYIYKLFILLSMLFSLIPIQAQPVFRWGVEFDLTTGFNRSNPVNWARDSSGRIVIAAASGDRIALFNLDGDTLSGWPTTETEDWWITAGPRLGDVTGDGEINVVVMMRSYWADNAQLRVYDLDGIQRDEFTHSRWDLPMATAGGTILFDIDDDGLENVVYAIDSVYAVDHEANQLPGFPRALHGLVAGEMAIVVIPDELIPGKALVSASADVVNIESLSTFTSLPGWPRPFPDSGGNQPQPVVVPFEDSWVIAMYADDSLYVWNESAENVPGFPVMPGTPGQIRDFSATDIDQDGLPEFSLERPSGEVWVFNLQGDLLPGFPWNEDRIYKGHGEDVLSLHIEGEDSARLFFPADLRIENTNQYNHGIMSLQGSSESAGYPVYNDRTEASYVPTSTIIWTGRSDTLHILHLASYGYLTMFDLPLPGASVKLIWPMPGGTPGGNRVYNPGPYVGVDEEPATRSSLPESPTIQRIYPNPSNGGVHIELALPAPKSGDLQIYNVLGQAVWSYYLSTAGQSVVVWPGENMFDLPVSSGRYFAQLEGSLAPPRPITIVR
jgi:hypothetical protein